jgi:hypothetical protein
MFVGHYAASLVAKRAAPQLPLWALLLAAQLVDVAWAVFILNGVEEVRIVPGHTAANPLDLYRMPYTHSLPAALAWAAAAAGLALVWNRNSAPRDRARRAGLVVGLVVLSHWFLDLLVHVPDLPLWGDRHKVGLGLWNHPLAASVLELGLLGAAAAWLRLDPMAWRRSGGRGLGFFIGVLALFHVANLWAPVPPSVAAVGWGGLGLYLLIAGIGWFLERRSRGKGDQPRSGAAAKPHRLARAAGMGDRAAER